MRIRYRGASKRYAVNGLLDIRNYVMSNSHICQKCKDLVIRQIDIEALKIATEHSEWTDVAKRIPDRIEERDGKQHAIYKSAV